MTSERRWWPDFLLDEVMPEGCASPDAWLAPAENGDLIMRLNGASAWSTALKPDIALPLLERWHTNPAALPLASILGTAILGQPVRAWEIVDQFGAVLNDSDRAEHCNFAWPMTGIIPLEPIAPARGAQGFWDWRPE